MNRLENHECLRCGVPLIRNDTENPFHVVCNQCEEFYKEAYWKQRNKSAQPFKNVRKIKLNVFGKDMTLGEAKKVLNR